MKELFTSVVVVAAGKGKRMNLEINKQYIEIAGKPLLARTIERFENLKDIDDIIIVVSEDEIEMCKEKIIDKFKYKKVKAIVSGGKERQDSVYNGINACDEESDIIMIHDGARPFISEQILKKSISETNLYGASVVAVPVKDTIKLADNEKNILKTLDRNKLWSIQTPQTFKKDIIINAYKKAYKDNFSGTDDAVIVENYGVKVKIVEGNYYNIKITTKEDLVFSSSIVNIFE